MISSSTTFNHRKTVDDRFSDEKSNSQQKNPNIIDISKKSSSIICDTDISVVNKPVSDLNRNISIPLDIKADERNTNNKQKKRQYQTIEHS